MTLFVRMFCVVLLGFPLLVYGAVKFHNQTIPKSVVNEETGSILKLRGIALGKYYAHDNFVAALYTQATVATPQDVLSDTGPKRMWIVYLRPVENHQLYWRNAIKINNAPQIYEQEQLKINQFLKMINSRLQAGDTLLIEFVPNVGTKVVIKGSFKGIIKGNEFFNLVLKTWLGRFPPSEKFRYDLFNLTKGFTYEGVPGKV